MTRYRVKPVEVEAMQMPAYPDRAEVRKIAEWMVERGYDDVEEEDDIGLWAEDYVMIGPDGELVGLPDYGSRYLLIDTPEDTEQAKLGDYVVRKPGGGFYPVKPDVFEATYAEVE